MPVTDRHGIVPIAMALYRSPWHCTDRHGNVIGVRKLRRLLREEEEERLYPDIYLLSKTREAIAKCRRPKPRKEEQGFIGISFKGRLYLRLEVPLQSARKRLLLLLAHLRGLLHALALRARARPGTSPL